VHRLRAGSRDSGNTLIELLVVIIIIAILAGIAIPVLIGQRRKAVDASLKSDLRTVATSMEAGRAENGAPPTTADAVRADGKTSPGNTVDVAVSGDDFCLTGHHPGGIGPSHAWVFDTARGGFVDDASAACASATTFSLP